MFVGNNLKFRWCFWTFFFLFYILAIAICGLPRGHWKNHHNNFPLEWADVLAKGIHDYWKKIYSNRTKQSKFTLLRNCVCLQLTKNILANMRGEGKSLQLQLLIFVVLNILLQAPLGSVAHQHQDVFCSLSFFFLYSFFTPLITQRHVKIIWQLNYVRLW